MKEHVEAARNAMENARIPASATQDVITLLAEALDRAGLLRTGLEQRAVEACEDLEDARTRRDIGLSNAELSPRQWRHHSEACVVGADSLALKQPPKPRWRVSAPNINGQCTVEGPVSYPLFTQEQAKAVAAALNACDTETRDA